MAAERAPTVRFQPIQQQRAHEYVADQIRRHIALRLIRPGESLPSERELASMFGVGRPTIQHALRLLEADVLVEARRGRGGGTFVVEPAEDEQAAEELISRLLRRRKELDELIVYRRVLEPATARLAAATRRKHDVARMREHTAALPTAPTEPEYMLHDTEFHIAVARATRNSFMAAQVEEIRMRLNDLLDLLPETDTWHRRIEEEHTKVTDAVEARDGDGAWRAMDEHMANAEQGLRAVLAAIKRRSLP